MHIFEPVAFEFFVRRGNVKDAIGYLSHEFREVLPGDIHL